MNKKLIIWILVLVLLVGSISAESKLKAGWNSVVDKFGDVEGFYDRNTQLVDFFVFFIIFFSLVYLGIGKFFEHAPAAKALAFAFGAILAFAGVKAGLTAQFFIPFVKNLMFFLILGVVYLVLINTGMQNQKIWAFIIALVVTFIIYNVALGGGGMFSMLKCRTGTYDEKIVCWQKEMNEVRNDMKGLDPQSNSYKKKVKKMKDINEKIKDLAKERDASRAYIGYVLEKNNTALSTMSAYELNQLLKDIDEKQKLRDEW